jgi:hypothetical protein
LLVLVCTALVETILAYLIHRERSLLLPFYHKAPLILVLQEPLHHSWDTGADLKEVLEAGLSETVESDIALYDL